MTEGEEPQQSSAGASVVAAPAQWTATGAPVLPPLALKGPESPDSRTSLKSSRSLPATPSLSRSQSFLAAQTPKRRALTEPATPQAVRRCLDTPPAAPRSHEHSLTKLLKTNNVEQVRSFLKCRPQAVSQFFWETNYQPVLCAAIKAGCGASMMQLLLENGADVAAVDTSGYTALTLLAASCPHALCDEQPNFHPFAALDPFGFIQQVAAEASAAQLQRFRRNIDVARVLIAAGLRPEAPDVKGRTAVEIAKGKDNKGLVKFLENFLEVQACAELMRAQSSPISGDVLHLVMGHLLPADVRDWVVASTVSKVQE